MDDHHSDKILSTMTMVWLKAGWFRGAVKLLAQDIKLGIGGKLPPEEVARLGSKLVFDPTELAVFGTLVKRAERALLAVGVRFMGGFAIPNEHLDVVRQELRTVEGEFKSALQDLISRYNDIVNDWIGKNPEFDDAIRRSILPVAEVESRCHFRFRLYGITVPDGVEARDTAESEVATMGDTLLDEVAVEVREIIRESIDGKPPRIKITIMNRIERVRRKLKALAFLDKDVKPVLDDLNSFISGVPEKGPIEGAIYHWMVSVLGILSDPAKVRSHAQALRQAAVTDQDNSLAGAGVVAGTTGDQTNASQPLPSSDGGAQVSVAVPVAASPLVADDEPVFVPPPLEDEDDDVDHGMKAAEPPAVPAFIPPEEDDSEDPVESAVATPPVPPAPVGVTVETVAAPEEAAVELDDAGDDVIDVDEVDVGGPVDLPVEDSDLFDGVPSASVAANAVARTKRPLRSFNFSS